MRSVIIALCLVAVINAQITCKFKGPSGKDYDFSPLKEDKVDYFVNIPQSATTPIPYTIKLNLCRPIIDTMCNDAGSDVAACQEWPTPDFKYHAALGSASGITFAEGKTTGEGGYGGTVSFTGMANQVNINFICEEKAGAGTPTFMDKPNQNTFLLQWKSKYACPAGFKEAASGGLSAGSVMLIILLVVTIVYFVGGILFQKFKNHAEGADLIPNRQFWTELPLLVRDGFKFVIGKVTGKSSSYQSV